MLLFDDQLHFLGKRASFSCLFFFINPSSSFSAFKLPLLDHFAFISDKKKVTAAYLKMERQSIDLEDRFNIEVTAFDTQQNLNYIGLVQEKILEHAGLQNTYLRIQPIFKLLNHLFPQNIFLVATFCCKTKQNKINKNLLEPQSADQ